MGSLFRFTGHNVIGLITLLMVGVSNSAFVVASVVTVTNTNGSVGYIYRSTDYDTGSYSNQNLLKANIDNSFFIWRDWFVTGSSSLVFTQEQTLSENGESGSFSSTGQIGFSVLPQSSMPFGFSYTRSDSKINSDFKLYSGVNAVSLDDNVISDSLVVHQSLVGKGYRLKVQYADDQFRSTLRGKYGSSKLSLSGMFRGRSGALRASVTQKDEVTYDKVDRKTSSARLNHNYTGFQQTTINTALSSSQIQQALPGATSLTNYDVTLNQASVSLIWRSLDKKLTVSSGLRFSGIESVTSSGLSGVSSSALSANVSLSYRITQNLSISANSLRSVNEFEGGESSVAQDRVGVDYRSDAIKLGDYSYDWRVAADLGRRSDDAGESNSSTFSLGHAVGRKWGFARSQQIYLRGAQDYSMSALVETVRQRLSHRVNLGWKQGAMGVSRRMQLQLSDQRDLGDETALQTLSVDVDQQVQMTRRIKLNGSLNYQLTSYQYASSVGEVSSSDTAVISMDGGLSYISPFSVAGLMFTSNYRYSQSVLAGVSELTVQQTWSNKLNYRVGKIDVSLQYLYREARQISYNSVYFSVRRIF